jgi:acetylornithine/succinyldiaminopimelate/putrescine aminotransferase
MGDAIADSLHVGDLGTTFGGGPLACAAITAVLRVIREEALLERVQDASARIRATCIVGPVESIQGRGLLLGLRTGPRANLVRDALLRQNILAGTSADPHVLRLLPPLTLGANDVDKLSSALSVIDL